MRDASYYIYDKGSELASAAVNKGMEMKEDPMMQNIASGTSRGFRSLTQNVKNVSELDYSLDVELRGKGEAELRRG